MSEFQKLTNLQSRLKKGAALKQVRTEGEKYVVQLSTEPSIAFDADNKEKVDRVLRDQYQI